MSIETTRVFELFEIPTLTFLQTGEPFPHTVFAVLLSVQSTESVPLGGGSVVVVVDTTGLVVVVVARVVVVVEAEGPVPIVVVVVVLSRTGAVVVVVTTAPEPEVGGAVVVVEAGPASTFAGFDAAAVDVVDVVDVVKGDPVVVLVAVASSMADTGGAPIVD